MTNMNRRDFLKAGLIGGAFLALDTAIMVPHLSAGGRDLKSIGECKKVSIKSISEIGWWSNKQLMADLKKAGGPKNAEQWSASWDDKNRAGSCTLVEIEGTRRHQDPVPYRHRLGSGVHG